jgi:hypothetical protein
MRSEFDPTFERRLSALENRVAKKSVTFFDQFKEWAGVITVLITLLYTYPLGFWDRFIVSREQVTSRQVDELRGLVIKLAELDADYGRTSGGIADSYSKNMYTVAMTTQKSALVARGLDLIKARYQSLTASEISLLAVQLLAMGQSDLAQVLFDFALQKSIAAKNAAVTSEIYRLKARLYLPDGPLGPNVAEVRNNFKSAMNELASDPGRRFLSQRYAIAGDWSQFEFNLGNVACGIELTKWGIEALKIINPSLVQTVQNTLSGWQWAPGANIPCPNGLIPPMNTP